MAARTNSERQPIIIDNVYYGTIVEGARALKVSATPMHKAINRAKRLGDSRAKVHGIEVIIVARKTDPYPLPREVKEQREHRRGEPLLRGLVTHRLGSLSSGRY